MKYSVSSLLFFLKTIDLSNSFSENTFPEPNYFTNFKLTSPLTPVLTNKLILME
jgi:hypothetical protein